MKIQISLSRRNTEDEIAAGRAVKIELVASTGDGFAERLTEFLTNVSNLTSTGASRSIGILDGSSDEESAIKLFIDGDGADWLRDVKVSK